MGDIEEQLSALRKGPGEDFVVALTRNLERANRPSRIPRRVGVAALSVAMLGALASVGGVSYAADAVTHAVDVARSAAVPAQSHIVRGLSAGGDQYRPGYGYGDPNHNHTGPPGLLRGGGAAPSLQARSADSVANVVATEVTFDEQCHLYVSVIDADRNELLLTQRSKRGGSAIGRGIDGPQTKIIQYLVLVPRSIPLSLRIPDNLLTPGRVYRIRIVAVDPQGYKSTLLVPFRA